MKLTPRALRDLSSDPARIIDALLIFVPIAIILELARADHTAIFITSALGIIPLAGILGEATDALAHRAGARVGALLNATLGNAAELIITITAIRAGLIEVVKASITGSIIGNILLVLGLSLLVGGLKNGFQRFGRRSASVSVTMMAIAVIGLVIPALFSRAIAPRSHAAVEYLSIGVAIALMCGYVLSVIFTFRLPGSHAREMPGEMTTPEHAAWSWRRSLGVLAVGVIAIAVLSEILVGAIEPLVRQQGLTELFVGVIVVPIIGNAAEHLVSVEMALKNKMELALGIALGSSMQIALFVAPLLVFISLLAGNPMSLVFNLFELAALIATVLIAALIALDGESNWLEGAQLLIVYVILALAFFYLPV
jgi:Ca2+:H+ antiporter